MKLDTALRFDEATCAGCGYTPNDDGGVEVMQIVTQLSRLNADYLLLGWLFTESVPHKIKGSPKDMDIVDADLEFTATNDGVFTLEPVKISSLNVEPIEDLGMQFKFRCHFVGDAMTIAHEFAQKVRKSKFNLVIRPREASLLSEVPVYESVSYTISAEPVEPLVEQPKLDGGASIPFTDKNVVGFITIGETEGGYAAEYSIDFQFRHPKKLGPATTVAYGSENEAKEAAACEMTTWLQLSVLRAVPSEGERLAAMRLIKRLRPFCGTMEPEPVEMEDEPEDAQPVEA